EDAGGVSQGENLLAAGDVPEPYRVKPGAGQALAVGAKRYTADTFGVSFESPGLLATGHVPQPYHAVTRSHVQPPSPVATRAGQPSAVEAEGHSRGSPVGGPEFLTAGHVPQLDLTGTTHSPRLVSFPRSFRGTGQACAVGAEGDPGISSVHPKVMDLLPGGPVP